MMNNSGTQERNDAPPNIGTSLHRPQTNASNINHNFNDFDKFMQQTAATASGYYETHNIHHIGQPPANIPPLIHPFQAYQNMGHGSQNTQFSYENAMHNYFPPVNSTTQAEHHNIMLNLNQHFHSNPTELQTNTTKKDFYPSSKSYPLNIPQVSSRIFEKSSSINKNNSSPQNLSENISTISQSIPQTSTNISQNITITEDTGLNTQTKSSPSSNILLENVTEELINNKDQYDNETPRNLTQKLIENTEACTKPTENIDVTPTIQRTTYNIVKNNSILKRCLTESKRKSLEKTVQLIESIIINSNNRSEVIENNIDPLAFSPNPDLGNTNINKNSKEVATDSDDEVLIKKVTTKNKRKLMAKRLSSKKNNKTQDSPVELSMEMPSQIVTVKVEDVKIEPFSLSDVEHVSPFHRDSNGLLSNVDGVKIINMEKSVNEALIIIKNGSTTNAYFECPHCSLLLHHPKRFLIHTKWHTFGLLNEKRAGLVKEREERLKERREARLVLKLTPLAPGEESVSKFPCKDCESVFPTKNGLKNHRHKVHPVKVSECRICLAPVRGMSELRAHMTSHETAGLHQCPRCPKRFKYRHSLAKHADTHREKTHSCSECGKLFGSHALVRLHMKTHERAERGVTHHCAYCGKGFYEAYNLQVHERTHRNDKPFQCNICESRFVTNSSLKRHVKVSHSGSKPYMCEICKKCFASATIRDRHELRVHSDQNQFTYQCKLCPKRYMKPKDLRSHTYKMHPKEKKKNISSDAEQSSS